MNAAGLSLLQESFFFPFVAVISRNILNDADSSLLPTEDTVDDTKLVSEPLLSDVQQLFPVDTASSLLQQPLDTSEGKETDSSENSLQGNSSSVADSRTDSLAVGLMPASAGGAGLDTAKPAHADEM